MTDYDTINFASGLIARIYQDTNADQPYSDDDAVRIVILHRRYIDPSKGACGSDSSAVLDWQIANALDWFTIPLFLYDHSGTVYRLGETNPFSCPWDSGRVGIIALKREDWGAGEEPDARMTEYAQGVAEAYTDWANGECYGFVLHDADGKEIDSCWGYLGSASARDEATASAASFHANS